jgi:hypothetical protein
MLLGLTVPSNNALQRTVMHCAPVLAKGWRARRGGMGIAPAAGNR